MTRQEAKSLVEKYNHGLATDREKAMLENWYTLKSDQLALKDGDIDFEHIDESVRTGTYSYAGIGTLRLWHRFTLAPRSNIRTSLIAAAAMAVITLGTWLYVSKIASSRKAFRNDGVVINDIAPGKNTAILTLGNGKTITLSDAKSGVLIGEDITYNDGSSLQGTKQSPDQSRLISGGEVQTLTATTPRGGTYQVTLPDGTRVWLNADSKISFPSQFNGKERKITMSGEAYFEVAKLVRSSLQGRIGASPGNLPEHVPFMVTSNGQEVTVLGTHFNINSYKDEGSIKTTLLEGSVKVSSLQGETTKRDNIILKPGQQSVIIGHNRIAVEEVDVAEVVAWKNSYFRFTDERIDVIMARLARWYNIEVAYEGAIPKERFNAAISRNKNISQVLNVLAKTNAVHFSISGRKVTVSKL